MLFSYFFIFSLFRQKNVCVKYFIGKYPVCKRKLYRWWNFKFLLTDAKRNSNNLQLNEYVTHKFINRNDDKLNYTYF